MIVKTKNSVKYIYVAKNYIDCFSDNKLLGFPHCTHCALPSKKSQLTRWFNTFMQKKERIEEVHTHMYIRKHCRERVFFFVDSKMKSCNHWLIIRNCFFVKPNLYFFSSKQFAFLSISINDLVFFVKWRLNYNIHSIHSVEKSSETRYLFLRKIHDIFRQINGFT